MRRFLLLLLLVAGQLVYAQPEDMLLLRDPLPEARSGSYSPYEHNWRFKEGDNSAYAAVACNDSDWQLVNPKMDSMVGGTPYYKFSGIGWLRLHIWADSSIVSVPLVLRLIHLGASEVYFDGQRLETYGYLGGKDSTEYYNPKNTPTPFVIPTAGHHVLAIRYANYAANANYAKYNNRLRGFMADVKRASWFTTFEHTRIVGITFILLLLAGVFGALAICHLFLFLYHRAVRSNLYFSIFCVALSSMVILLWLERYSPNTVLNQNTHYTMPVLISLVCFSLSGFVNHLFSTRKLRFAIISFLCVAVPFVFWKTNGIIPHALLALIVLIETMVLIIRAMVRRVKGARIIGAGLLLFAAFMCFNVVYILIMRSDVSLTDGTVGQVIFSVLAALSIVSLPVSMSLFLAWNFASINKELKKNLQQVKELSEKTIAQELEKTRMIENQNVMLERQVAARTAEVVAQKEILEHQHTELKTAKHKSDELLLNILPEEVAEELKEKGHTEARLFNNVSVLFTDFVGFTKAGERMSPQELVDELHVCFRTFDEIISKYRIEKIKTIGDAYLAVAGLPAADEHHALSVTRAALEIQAFMKERKSRLGDKTFEIRIGIHSGSVVAGIVGIKKFAYDIWGDTVNTAARMESSSEAGRVNVSEPTYMLIKEQFDCTYRGKIDAKNKGEMNMYFVEKEKH